MYIRMYTDQWRSGMEESWFDSIYLVNRPAIVETFVDVLLCAVPIWLALLVGLVIGWSWRPRWTDLVFLGFRSKLRFVWTAPPGFGARRLWLALTALSAFSVARRLWSRFRGKAKDSSGSVARLHSESPMPVEFESRASSTEVVSGGTNPSNVTSQIENVVTENDLEHLLHLLESKDREIGWHSMMERSASNLTYQAWRHEPEMGPTIYCTRTVFEDASPESVRDFFWDDEFRTKWDPMLAYFRILEECPHKGVMIIHWIKKFPFFCSDREYIIGRRIWEDGKTYYCVTKGVPYPGLQRRYKPRRVDLYFSSWVIKPVPSRKGDGQLSACEVTLVHSEDMGIPKDVAKIGVRHGMWGTVQKLHSGFRAYQQARKSDAPLSRSALMARITTNISCGESTNSLETAPREDEENEDEENLRHGDRTGINWKWVVIGGTVALVCGLRTGVIRKALLLGVGQSIGRRRQ